MHFLCILILHYLIKPNIKNNKLETRTYHDQCRLVDPTQLRIPLLPLLHKLHSSSLINSQANQYHYCRNFQSKEVGKWENIV